MVTIRLEAEYDGPNNAVIFWPAIVINGNESVAEGRGIPLGNKGPNDPTSFENCGHENVARMEAENITATLADFFYQMATGRVPLIKQLDR